MSKLKSLILSFSPPQRPRTTEEFKSVHFITTFVANTILWVIKWEIQFLLVPDWLEAFDGKWQGEISNS